jgi:hypothetical protein
VKFESVNIPMNVYWPFEYNFFGGVHGLRFWDFFILQRRGRWGMFSGRCTARGIGFEVWRRLIVVVFWVMSRYPSMSR